MIENNSKQGIYIVGGYVRDLLLNKTPQDKDFCVVGYSPQQMINKGYKQVGKDFSVFLDKVGQEYALPRSDEEQYSNQKQKGQSKKSILESDLGCRDLTINAMALDMNSQLIDPFQGQQDIDNRMIRHINHHFKDDPLRVLRVARFYAQLDGFQVAEETKDIMKELVQQGAIQKITSERLFMETEKALKTDNPQQYFELLEETGALYEFMPEVANLKGIPQPKQHHPEIDSFVHTMMVLQQASLISSDPVLRFGALTHDVGKTLTPENQWPRHIGHEKAGIPLVQALCERIKVPNQYRETAEKACELHMKIHEFEKTSSNKINRLFQRMGKNKPNVLYNVVMISKADSKGRLGKENTPYPQANTLIQCYDQWNRITVKNEAEKHGKNIETMGTNAIKQMETEGRIQAIEQVRQKETSKNKLSI